MVFADLGGYGSQLNNHIYAPITPWPADMGYGDVEAKVKRLQPQLVRIFYNDNWDANANGQFPELGAELRVVRPQSVDLAQEAGATILVSYQNLGNARRSPAARWRSSRTCSRHSYARDENVRWAEVGNEPNDPRGQVTLEEYNALYRALTPSSSSAVCATRSASWAAGSSRAADRATTTSG